MLNVAFSELKMKKGKVVLTNRGSILIDIDDFKKVNDDFGHLVGDQTLIRVADILRRKLGPEDVITRWGGEEFAVLIEGEILKSVAETAQKIREAVEEDMMLGEILGRPLTVSIGVGELTTLESQDGLIHKVDEALYKAKRTGKNQVIVAPNGFGGFKK